MPTHQVTIEEVGAVTGQVHVWSKMRFYHNAISKTCSPSFDARIIQLRLLHADVQRKLNLADHILIKDYTIKNLFYAPPFKEK